MRSQFPVLPHCRKYSPFVFETQLYAPPAVRPPPEGGSFPGHSLYLSERLPKLTMASDPEIYTIGHSTLAIDEFTGILTANGIKLVVDVRTVPRSRANPQFDKQSLPASLKTVGIGYKHFPCLGGLRKPRKDSPNTAWVNSSFRGYADYMLTEEFEECLNGLLSLIATISGGVTLMCAEAVPWRCHRSLIADALYVRGLSVTHLVGKRGRRGHTLTKFAVVHGKTITYPNTESGS